ncbi:MAG: alcohol dehydrogenase catalytic domain-containing protein [Caldilineaceae bacterium]
MARTGRVVVANGQNFDVREYPVADPGPGAILLRQELAGICGTDLHMWQGIPDDMVLGHENVGVIEAIGKDVTSDFVGKPIREGDRIIFAPARPTAPMALSTPKKSPIFMAALPTTFHCRWPTPASLKPARRPKWLC